MKPRSLPDLLLRLALLFAVPALACNLPTTGGAESAPAAGETAVEPTITPTETPTPSPPLPTAEPVFLDLCTLFTQEEIEAMMGVPVEVQPFLEMGSCSYSQTGGDGTTMPRSLAISTAQGGEARGLIIAGIATMMIFSGDPDAQASFEYLQENAGQMSLEEVYAEVPPLFETVGYIPTPIEGFGDQAYWFWNAEFSIGATYVAQNDMYASATLIGDDEASAAETTRQLTEMILARVPPSFYVLPEEEAGGGEPTAEPAAETPTEEATAAAQGPDTVWVTDVRNGQIVSVDPAAQAVTARYSVGIYPIDIAYGAGSLWVPSQPEDTVSRIDPANGTLLATIAYAGKIWRADFGHGALWTAGQTGLARIDPASSTAETVVGEPCHGVAIGETSIWATLPDANQVLKVDPGSGAVVARFSLTSSPTEISFYRGKLWVLQPDEAVITRLDPETGKVIATVNTGSQPRDVFAGTGGVWVAVASRVRQIDPVKAVILNVINVGGSPYGVITGQDGVWVAVANTGQLVLIDLLHYEILYSIEIDGQPDRIAIQR